MSDFDLVARGLVTDTRAELEKAEATIVELRTWAEDLNELRNNLAQAAGTALTVLQDALKSRGPAADLREQARDAEMELAKERADHAKTTEGLRICGEAFVTQQQLTAKVQAELEATRQAWATAVVASMREHPVEDWLPVVLAFLPPEIAGLVHQLVAAEALEKGDS